MNGTKFLFITSMIASLISFSFQVLAQTQIEKSPIAKPVKERVVPSSTKDNAKNSPIKNKAKKAANEDSTKKDRFIPTEAISEDLAVSFPTDI